MSERVPDCHERQPLSIASSQAYYLRDEDYWTNIDYSKQAHTWMSPLRRGKETGLVEIPANWSVSEASQPYSA